MCRILCWAICEQFGQVLNEANSIWHGGPPDLTFLQQSGADCLPGLLGMEFVGFGDDWLKARMPVDARVHQPFGRLHGGASVALAETVGSMAASCVIDRSQFVAVGMEINANHIRPVYSGWIYATAKAESLGRTTQIWTIRIEDEAGKLVCLSRPTMAVIALDRS